MRTSVNAAAAGLALLLALSVSLAGCHSPSPDDENVRAEGVEVRKVSLVDAPALPDVVDATHRMGTILLRAARNQENSVVSPASAAVALAMLTEGAKGTTLAELEAALGASGDARRDAFAALQQALREHDGDPATATAETLPERPLVHVANRVVVDDELLIEQTYLEALTEGFDAGARHTDLGDDSARAVLGEWIDHHTGGLIEESAIAPGPALRLVLQDVVLLAARWQTPFSPESTSDRPFNLPSGSAVQVETMSANGEFRYVEQDGWSALRLPYTEALHADLLLPPPGVDPADVTSELLTEIGERLEEATPEDFAVSLPTLDLSPPRLNLIDTGALEALGVTSALCSFPQPDLSGIGLTPGDLCLGQAVQQAVLTVDEEGTVAAAVTELGLREVSMALPPRTVSFDRPFLLEVAHSETGWPLFLAAVRDPRH